MSNSSFNYYNVEYNVSGDKMKSDIEIANMVAMEPIGEVAKKLGLDINDYEMYGKYKAKLDLALLDKKKKQSNLILVTSINPTPYGEGKTTISIGLNDALCKLGKNSLVVLREPSLGPVFGTKGGATGGGLAQVVPMEDINLHFTGDLHAITTCNNLLSSVIDNHIFQGNELKIDINRIQFNRTIDLNDRFLRNIEIGYQDIKRHENFNITAASEIMAILCLASSIKDLRERLGNILVAYSLDDKPIFAHDLNCVDSLLVVLKEAIRPNLVQTLEHNPAIIHGGPFANIAHGCNSLIATNMALNLADYVVTEAGFGSDLGAEKFFDIKCRVGNLKPKVVVINTTIRSLKYNGNDILENGLKVLGVHIENMCKYMSNVVVCLNKFTNDTTKDIDIVKDYCQAKKIDCILVEAHSKGSDGAIDLANKVIELSHNDSDFKPLYDINLPIKEKIDCICKEIYRASNIVYTNEILEKIEKLNRDGFSKLPICIAKTQYSLSDNPKLVGVVDNFDITIKDIKVSNGAGFIVVYLGSILTLPGLGKDANVYNIKIDDELNISGLI